MPEKKQVINIQSQTTENILALSYGAMEALNWTIKYAVDNKLFAYTPRNWNKYEDEITIEAAEGELTITSKLIHGESFDLTGKNKKHIVDFDSSLNKLRQASETQLNEWKEKIEQLRHQTVYAAEEEIKKAEEINKVMHSSRGMQVTYGLIAINTIIFIAMVASGINAISPSGADLLPWGVNYAPLTYHGEWWRLITSIFLHFGIIHLALNMYALFYIGTYLEPMLGKVRFIAAYLCSGIIASVASLYFHRDNPVPSAGASGAIFGMYGVFLALLTTNLIPKQVRNAMLQSVLIFVGYNIFYGFRQNSGIDNAAHLGGLISGMLIGYAFFPALKTGGSQKQIQSITGLVAIVTVMLAFFTIRNTPPANQQQQLNEVGDWQFSKVYDEFSKLEEQAIKPLRDSSLSGPTLAQKLEQVSLPNWQKANKILNAANEYNLSPKSDSLRTMLKNYIQLRTQETELLIKKHRENSTSYDSVLSNVEIELVKILQSQ